MALAYLTINLDAFTGDDHPPVPSYSTIKLDPGADHIDAAADVIHVRTIVVSLDRQGKAATANGVPCVDGKVPVVAGVAYAVSAPNVLRGGPHYIPALTAGQVVDLSDYITPGAPLTPDQASVLAARVTALEATPLDAEAVRDAIGVALIGTGLISVAVDDAADTITISTTATANATDAALRDRATHTGAQAISTVTGLQAALDGKAPSVHTHTAAQVSDSTTTGRALVTATDAAAARGTLGLGTAATTAATAYATAAQGAKADTAVQPGALATVATTGAYADLSGRPTVMTPTAHTHGVTDLTATGTRSATTYLRGDGTWATPTGPLTGTGSPEGVVTAPVGTEYLDTAGTLGAWRWLKTSGTGTTGWKVTYGDTGWRNMQAEFESICTANSLTFSVVPGYNSPKIRRVGDLLLLDVGVNITGTGANTIDFRSAFGQNLNGFKGGPNNRQIPASVTGSAGVIHWAPYYYVKFWSPGLQTLNVVWPITDTAPWPTSLPGTPA